MVLLLWSAADTSPFVVLKVQSRASSVGSASFFLLSLSKSLSFCDEGSEETKRGAFIALETPMAIQINAPKSDE